MNGVRVNRATRQILYRGQYPNLYGDPIGGYGRDGTEPEEWLIDNIPVSIENYLYDPRYYHLVTTEVATLIEHPMYPGVNQFLITYSTPKLPIADILVNLEGAENNANETALPYHKQLKYIVIAINAVRKLTQEIPLQSYEITVLTKFAAYANAIASNYANADVKKTLIEADQEPDMDSGWTTSIE